MLVNWLKRGVLATCLAALMALGTTARANDIVTTAVEAGSFKTLAAALEAAGLVDTLKSGGPFTVFAPTDEAFAKLPSGTVENLLKPENKGQLIAVLTYHVVPGAVKAADVVQLSGATTVNGQRAEINAEGGKVMVDNANVIKADIECSNGVIHVIDQVILPASDNIVETASKAGKFGTLIAAAKAAGLVEALTGNEAVTVFAPTDEAFAKLPAGTVENLLKPENKGQLVNILKYHVVPGRVYSTDLLSGSEANPLFGNRLNLSIVNGAPRVENAGILKADIDAANGVIHVIDAVLIPGQTGAHGASTRSINTHATSTCPSSSY